MNVNKFLLMLSFLYLNFSFVLGQNEGKNRQRAIDSYELIQKYYSTEIDGAYKENFPKQPGENKLSYLWSHVALVKGVNVLLQLGADAESSRYKDDIDRFEAYFVEEDQPAGYQDYPKDSIHSKKFYDDNAIVGIELLLAYENYGTENYLKRAKQAMDFIMTGESDDCGGAVFWNDEEFRLKKGIKGMSANGFPVYLALRLYQKTNNQDYLDFALRTYSWLRENLYDPIQHIYWNDISVPECKLNKDLYSYNSAIMILNDLLLYEITGEDRYLKSAQETGEGSYATFTVKSGEDRFIRDGNPWFAVILLESFIELAKYDPEARLYVQTFEKSLDYAWENARNSYGLFYENWSGSTRGRDFMLLFQGCMIESYGRLALYEAESKQGSF